MAAGVDKRRTLDEFGGPPIDPSGRRRSRRSSTDLVRVAVVSWERIIQTPSLRPIRTSVRVSLTWLRDKALSPVSDRLDTAQEAASQRFDNLQSRMKELEIGIQVAYARVATVTERLMVIEENQIELEQRLAWVQQNLDSFGERSEAS